MVVRLKDRRMIMTPTMISDRLKSIVIYYYSLSITYTRIELPNREVIKWTV